MAWTVEAVDRCSNWDVLEREEDAAYRRWSWTVFMLRKPAIEIATAAVSAARESMGDEYREVKGWGNA